MELTVVQATSGINTGNNAKHAYSGLATNKCAGISVQHKSINSTNVLLDLALAVSAGRIFNPLTGTAVIMSLYLLQALVNTTVATLISLASVGAIITGTWNETVLRMQNSDGFNR
jgi:hypothetical protein